jgi:hypothetical protein
LKEIIRAAGALDHSACRTGLRLLNDAACPDIDKDRVVEVDQVMGA